MAHAFIKNPGMVLAVSSALLYCVLNVGVRFMLADLTVWDIVLTRGLVGAATLLLVGYIWKINVFGKHKVLLTLIGLFGCLSSVCTTTAISRIPLYQALVLLYLYPALTVPMAYFINGVRVRLRACVLVTIAFAGCLCLIWPDNAAGLALDIGHLIGFFGACFYSLAYVLISRLGDDNCGLEPMFYYCLWAIAGVAIAALAFDLSTGLGSLQTVVSGIGLGFLAVLPLLAGYAALRWLEPFKVGVIGNLEVFGGALASWLIFSDPITMRALFGGLIILIVSLQLRRA